METNLVKSFLKCLIVSTSHGNLYFSGIIKKTSNGNKSNEVFFIMPYAKAVYLFV